MEDAQFEVLKVQASIAPKSADWPSPDYSKVSIQGDRPHAAAGELHWGLLHDSVNDLRTRTLKALGKLAAVDEDKTLSATGKAEKKQEIASAAIASFEKSGSLEKARSAVENQVAKWNDELGVTPKLPTDVATAMMHAEIRSRVSAQKPGDRLAYISGHIEDCGAAILTAPPMLSGLSATELNIVRHTLELRTNPEVAKAKQDTMQALVHAEQGFRNAVRTIRERAGLDAVPSNGGMA